jgi:hypothetical protein
VLQPQKGNEHSHSKENVDQAANGHKLKGKALKKIVFHYNLLPTTRQVLRFLQLNPTNQKKKDE